MPFDPEHHHRRTPRLRDHDYTAGAYFVTICTEQRACLFGDVVDREMKTNAIGLLVERMWIEIEAIRPNVEIDVFALMPDHLHGIVSLRAEEMIVDRFASGFAHRRPRSLSSIVAQFKASSTVAVNGMRSTPGTRVWQKGFYEHVIRNEQDFDHIAEYIVTNPERWRQPLD